MSGSEDPAADDWERRDGAVASQEQIRACAACDLPYYTAGGRCYTGTNLHYVAEDTTPGRIAEVHWIVPREEELIALLEVAGVVGGVGLGPGGHEGVVVAYGEGQTERIAAGGATFQNDILGMSRRVYNGELLRVRHGRLAGLTSRVTPVTR